MIIKIIANLACSFIGTIAYAVMFQVPRRFYIGCGIITAYAIVPINEHAYPMF